MFLYIIAAVAITERMTKNKIKTLTPNTAFHAVQTCCMKIEEIIMYILKNQLNLESFIINNHNIRLLES